MPRGTVRPRERHPPRQGVLPAEAASSVRTPPRTMRGGCGTDEARHPLREEHYPPLAEDLEAVHRTVALPSGGTRRTRRRGAAVHSRQGSKEPTPGERMGTGAARGERIQRGVADERDARGEPR